MRYTDGCDFRKLAFLNYLCFIQLMQEEWVGRKLERDKVTRFTCGKGNAYMMASKLLN